MPRQGKKSMRGQADSIWGETKSAKLTTDLTPTGKALLKGLAVSEGTSVSEILEKFSRGRYSHGLTKPLLLRFTQGEVSMEELISLSTETNIPLEWLINIQLALFQ